MRAVAILVAAGPGTRLGASVPKAFVRLAGEPLYAHALRALTSSSAIADVIVVVPVERVDEARAGVAALGLATLPRVVAGGAERADSVRAGLAAAGDVALVAVHDAARPFVSADVIERVVAAAARHGAAIAAVPAIDTVKLASAGGVIASTPPRDSAWLAQTPQVFRTELLRAAHAAHGQRAATDDAMLVELLGAPVHLVSGDTDNRKITTADDLRWAEWFLGRDQSPR